MSDEVEEALDGLVERMLDRELACLVVNCLPNTLDTTIYLFHDSQEVNMVSSTSKECMIAYTLVQSWYVIW